MILHVYKKEREKFHVKKKKKPNQKNEKYYHVLKVQHFSNVFIEVSLKSYRFNFNLLDSLINMFQKDVLR